MDKLDGLPMTAALTIGRLAELVADACRSVSRAASLAAWWARGCP